MDTNRHIGPFEILEPLGAGGMGEVFKARDTRLNRFVALKFLPEAATPAARERFQREAMAIAALNHAHICTLYEVGDDGGRPYLVLELLEGETLRARLRRGRIAHEQLLDWAIEAADALDAAHRKGVLHRDLKPENLWVTSSGHIKVLDFGLARLEADDAGEAATIGPDRLLTSPGQTMGTVPYMSPEQARGEALDARSDLFSFGSVLYEMASGRPAFPGRSAAEITAGILKEQPPRISSLRADAPPMLEQITSRCLEKDPDLRYQSAADLRGELKRLKRESGSGTAAVAAVPRPRRNWLWPTIAAIVIIAAAGLAYWRLRPRAAAPPPQLSFRQLTFSGHIVDAIISPDGKFLAHVDVGPRGTTLHLLSISSGSDVEIVPPGGGCCHAPSFSPDGGAVYFVVNNNLESVPVLGGTVRAIATGVCGGAGFSPDGSQIAYIEQASSPALNYHLVAARPDGSGAHVLAAAPPGMGFDSPHCWVENAEPDAPAWSPDGRSVAVILSGSIPTGRVDVIRAADGHAQTLGPEIHLGASGLAWLPDGSGLVFTAGMTAGAAPQLWRLNYPGGELLRLTNDLQGYSSVSLSADGEAVLIHGAPQYSMWTQTTPSDALAQVPGGGLAEDGFAGVAWTPQDRLVTVRILGGVHQVWEEDPDGGNAHALATTGDLSDPVVAPNGTIVLDSNFHARIWRMNPDGSGLTELLHPPADVAVGSPGLADNGATLVYIRLDAHGNENLYAVPLAGGTPREIWNRTLAITDHAVDPSGHRSFNISIEQGRSQGIVLNLDAPQAAPTLVPVPMESGSITNEIYGWTPDGKAVTYVVNQGTVDNLWAQPVSGGKPYPLTHFTDLRIAAYAFSHDGRLALSRGADNTDAVVATGLAPGGGH